MTETLEYKRTIPETPVPGKPLGRHVRHDPRSLDYLVEPARGVVTTNWHRETPVLDQGDLGSCTGNATTGVLGSDPFYAVLQQLMPNLKLDEAEAVKIYSAATLLDNDPDHYPPTDTGSDGLSVAKAAQNAGLISGYQHIISLAAAKTAIAKSPFITGVNWYTSMDDPDSRGLVTVGGTVRGGHEFEVLNYDAANDVWEFVNSWGTSYGLNGHFFMTSVNYMRLLGEEGDATQFTPLTAPAPSPTPAPTPAPTPSGDDHVADFYNAAYDWAKARHTGSNAKAAAAALKLFAAEGFNT